jgi:type II secretory pathway pseudopilin PulG
MLNKKGAMFGLDARIALAIFGALSVISGASLYSAIQESKVVALQAQFNEVEKSIEQYILDIGSAPPKTHNWVDLSYLMDNKDSNSNWNGPYISGFVDSGVNLVDPKYLTFKIVKNNITDCSTSAGTSDGTFYYNINQSHNSDYYLTLAFLKKYHDKYDTDGDYDSGSIIVKGYPSANTSAAGYGCVLIEISKPISNLFA